MLGSSSIFEPNRAYRFEMSNSGLILTDVIEKEKETDPKSIAKSKNPSFISQSSGVTKLEVEDNRVLSTSDDKTNNSVIISGTINSENRVYSDRDKEEFENGYAGVDESSVASGVYSVEVLLSTEQNNNNEGESIQQEIDISKTPSKVRCSCPYYRFHYSAANDDKDFLFGKEFPTYIKKTDRPPSNPNENVGMCKHIIHFISHLLKTTNNDLKIIDSSGKWNSTVSSTNLSLDKPKQKSYKRKKDSVSDTIRVNNILSNSKKLKKATSVSKPAIGSGDDKSTGWNKYVDDSFRKLKNYDNLVNKYGSDVEINIKNTDNVDGYNSKIKTLGDLRRHWQNEYNKRVKELLSNKYKDPKVVDSVLKKKTKDGELRFVLPTKSSKRLRNIPKDELALGSKISTSIKGAVKRKLELNKTRKAKKYIIDIAKKSNKTPSEIKNDFLLKAKDKNMKLSDYVISIMNRNTDVANNSVRKKSKKTNIDSGNTTKSPSHKRKTDTIEDKIKKALRKKNEKILKLDRDSKLSKDDPNKMTISDREKERKEIDKLDNFLKLNKTGYVPEESIKSRNRISSPSIKKTDIKINAPTKNKQKNKSTTVIKKNDTDNVSKIAPVNNKFDPQVYDFVPKRDKKKHIIVPEKPSMDSNDETKFFYLKSLNAKLQELRMLSKNMENGSIRSTEEQRESVKKAMNHVTNDIIKGCVDFGFNLKDL